MQHIATIDMVIIGVYFAVILSIGLWFARKERTSTDYFLASRDVNWFVVGASLFATNISSEHFIGLSGSGASTGLPVGHFEWLACLIVLLLGWVFVPFYHRSNVYTMPEFLERRYNSACRMYLTSISIIAYVLTKISVSLYAGSVLLQATVGWDFHKSAIILVILTGIYTIAGGLAAVVYTDMVQAFILIGGAMVLTILGLNKVGGFVGLRAALPPDFFHMIRPASDPQWPWTGIFLGAPILGLWYWCTDQVIVQKTLCARNIEHGRLGAILSGYLKILPVFILVLPGLIAKALYPDVTGDNAYPTLVIRLLPAGLTGLTVAALLAALMGGLSSTFNSSSTLVTFDFYRKLNPQASEAMLVRVGRIVTGVMVLLGILWVPFMKYISSQLFIYLQSVQAYISPPIAACFLLGVLWKRLNGAGAISALLTGFVLGMFRLILEVWHGISPLHSEWGLWIIRINFLHYAIYMFVICSLLMAIVSLLTPAPSPEKLAGLTFATAKEGGDWEGANPMPAARKKGYHLASAIASVVLVITMISLWYHFR